jgi:uncharacterized protein (DUF58 family)
MITWRVPALVAVLGAATVWWVPSPFLTVGLILGAVGLLAALDWLLAAPAGEVVLRREGPRQVRLGESVTVALSVRNDSVRTMRALVRDAWVPSAGPADPYAHVLQLDPGDVARI